MGFYFISLWMNLLSKTTQQEILDMTETPDCLSLLSAATKYSNKQQCKSEAVHLAHSFRLHPAMAGKSQLGGARHSVREPTTTHSEAENDQNIHALTLPTSTLSWIRGLEKQYTHSGQVFPYQLT